MRVENETQTTAGSKTFKLIVPYLQNGRKRNRDLPFIGRGIPTIGCNIFLFAQGISTMFFLIIISIWWFLLMLPIYYLLTYSGLTGAKKYICMHLVFEWVMKSILLGHYSTSYLKRHVSWLLRRRGDKKGLEKSLQDILPNSHATYCAHHIKKCGCKVWCRFICII